MAVDSETMTTKVTIHNGWDNDQRKYLVFSLRDNGLRIRFNLDKNRVYGYTRDKELIDVLCNNNIKLTIYRALQFVHREDIEQLLEAGYFFNFNFTKTNEEFIDFFCGNSWPEFMNEFIEKVVTYLTRDIL